MKYRGETVLLYHLTEERYSKLQPVLIRMGIKVRIMEESQINQKIGALFKLPGFNLEESDGDKTVAPSEEVMLMNGFSSKRLNEFLTNMKKANVGIISLKAIVTAENVNWKFIDLYQELNKEHQNFIKYREEQKNKRTVN